MAASTVASGVEIIIRPMGGCRFESAPGHGWRREGSSAVIGLGDLSAVERGRDAVHLGLGGGAHPVRIERAATAATAAVWPSKVCGATSGRFQILAVPSMPLVKSNFPSPP